MASMVGWCLMPLAMICALTMFSLSISKGISCAHDGIVNQIKTKRITALVFLLTMVSKRPNIQKMTCKSKDYTY
jgi:hypothetical protein